MWPVVCSCFNSGFWFGGETFQLHCRFFCYVIDKVLLYSWLEVGFFFFWFFLFEWNLFLPFYGLFTSLFPPLKFKGIGKFKSSIKWNYFGFLTLICLSGRLGEPDWFQVKRIGLGFVGGLCWFAFYLPYTLPAPTTQLPAHSRTNSCLVPHSREYSHQQELQTQSYKKYTLNYTKSTQSIIQELYRQLRGRDELCLPCVYVTERWQEVN